MAKQAATRFYNFEDFWSLFWSLGKVKKSVENHHIFEDVETKLIYIYICIHIYIFLRTFIYELFFGFLPGLRPQLASISWRMVWTLFRDPPENSMCQKIYSTSYPVLQTQGILVEPFPSDINPTSNYSEIFFILAEAVVPWITWGFKGLVFWSRL